MDEAVIAVNRFGLGLRAGEALPANGKAWLLDQFAAFTPASPPIAATPDMAAIAAIMKNFDSAKNVSKAQKRKAEAKAAAAAQGAAPIAAVAMTASAQTANAKGAGGKKGDFNPAYREARDQLQQVFDGAVAARSASAITTNAPFVERLVHFWSNHFAVSVDNRKVAPMAGAFEFEAIRPHVLGNFHDMVSAVEHHPAMLVYLDNAISVGPNSQASKYAGKNGKKRGLNENLGREIMELHTLGVRSGYSQADVTEFARALTGWTAAGIRKSYGKRDDDKPGGFSFAANLHEPGSRTIMGKTYPAGGEEQAAAVLKTLSVHPATASHIATKLARHFAGDTPPPTLVAKLDAAFLKSGGDLPTVYRVLIESPEAWASQPVKFKTPWEWAVSSARAVGPDAFPAAKTAAFVKQLGQTIWSPGSPAGFDDIAASWAGPDAIMRRVEAAQRIAARAKQTIDARATASAMFGNTLTAATKTSIDRAENAGEALALLLVSPEFMRR